MIVNTGGSRKPHVPMFFDHREETYLHGRSNQVTVTKLTFSYANFTVEPPWASPSTEFQ